MACIASIGGGISNERPSSWPVRRQRRDFALQKYHSEVLAAISGVKESMAVQFDKVNVRLGQLETSLCSISTESKESHGEARSSGNDPCLLAEAVSRIDRMELLLFRTSLYDFQMLDAEVLEILPKCASRACAQVGHEPESERSPVKDAADFLTTKKVSSKTDRDGDTSLGSKTLYFDISDNGPEQRCLNERLDVGGQSIDQHMEDASLATSAELDCSGAHFHDPRWGELLAFAHPTNLTFEGCCISQAVPNVDWGVFRMLGNQCSGCTSRRTNKLCCEPCVRSSPFPPCPTQPQ